MIGCLKRFGLHLAGFPDKLLQAATLMVQAGVVPYRPGWWVCEAGGNGPLEWVAITDGKRTVRVDCDMLALGYGLVPNSELARLMGCRTTGSSAAPGAHFVDVDARQKTSLDGVFACGEITGIGGAELSLAEGSVAGYAACGHWHEVDRVAPLRNCLARQVHAMDSAFALRDELRAAVTPDTLVCRCEDVPAAELAGFGSWREAKLGSRCGMGPCQGRTCGPAVEFVWGWSAESVRPPITPVRLGSMSDQP